ncbi:complement C1q domain-containing protein, partial [Planktomarina sp.]|nr:complement C1q domain-containing protein [Planktomarina sp.]
AGSIAVGTSNLPSDVSVVAADGIKFDVGTSDTTRIYAKSTGTGAYSLGSSGGSAIAFHRLADNSDEIGFETHHAGNNHTERMRLNYHGQLTLEGTGTPFDTTPSKNGLQLYYESDSGIATFGSYSNGGGTALDFRANSGGNPADANAMRIGSNYVTVNPDANDHDFRVASDGNSSMLFVDGGNNRVGVGTNTPTHDLTIGMPDLGDASLSFRSSTYSSLGTIKVSHDSGTAESSMRFHTRTGGNEPERMRITSAGLIGVNTISPTQEVSVAGNIDLQSTSGSNATMRRIAWRNTNSSGFEVSNIQGYTGANIYEGQIGFQTKDSGGSMNERMHIDSAGRVTMPYQPAFSARSPSGGTNYDGGTDTARNLLFASIITNNGSHYNTSNGRFTAPVTGHYYFAFNLLWDDSYNGTGYFSIRKNDTDHRAYSYIQDNGSYPYGYLQFSGSAVVQLNANEWVTCYANIPGIHVGGESNFTGFLIG